MVNDKFQVRSTGPVNSLTMQPVKGRKRSGGIRVGEMERDALIGHGTSFLLQDRLLNCSDYTQTPVCRSCGSILTTQTSVPRIGSMASIRCRRCAVGLDKYEGYAADSDIWEDGHGKKFVVVTIPQLWQYLCIEIFG